MSCCRLLRGGSCAESLGLTGLLMCAFLVGSTGQALAALEQEPIRLEYSADAGCPSAEEFQRMVFERTRSARPADPDETARLFSVTLRREPRTIRGSLTVREGEQNLVREVNGRNCDDLASVLALATALAIDPSAELLPKNDEAEALAEPNEATTTAATTPPQRTTPAVPQPAQDDPLPYDPPDALPSDSTFELLQVAVGPRVDWGATPYAAVGPSLALEFGPNGSTWRFGVAANALFTPTKEVAGAEADFRIISGSVKVCTLAFRWRNWVQAGPCIGADFGGIYAASSGIPFRETTHRFWSIVGAHLELLTNLSEDWTLVVGVGPNLVLTQYRFEFNEPDTEVFEHGTWTGSARLTLGYNF